MLTPGTITVTFTANYAGPHRICWRQCGSGPYVCTNIVDCAGGGNVCSAVISVMVDPETCNPVCFEGYIQATCNPEESSIGQVPWTTTFTPNPVCKGFIITNTSLATIPNTLGPTVPAIDMGLNCNGTARPDLAIYNGLSVRVCATTTIPNLPAQYVMVKSDFCCYDCTNYSITISPACTPGCSLDESFMYYIDCDTRELKKVDFTGNTVTTLNICAVTGSVSLQLTSEAIGTVNTVGPCP